ncbi:MAG: hypothetical protein ACJ788_11790 [Ktedonobacteraceae bacterium]|jgi:transcriptional regulator with XRE-family HTH domain
MDREREEAILRITAQYVEEVKAGRQPQVSTYIARYPHYADEIADFVAYYHAFEASLPPEPEITPELTQDFHIAKEYAWQRVLHTESKSTKKLASLLIAANEQGLSLSQVASKLNVSTDIVMKLEHHFITASTIPHEVLNRLAAILQQPLSAIQAYLKTEHRHTLQKQQVAEAHALYHVNEDSAIHVQSFREAIEASEALTPEQKSTWQHILNEENL